MLRPAAWVLAISIGMLFASGSAGADATFRPASVAAPHTRLAPPVHTHITWKGYRGVRPGETLAHAAARLDGTVQPDCVFRYVAYGGPVRLDNGVRSRSRRVEEMITHRRVMIGPRGVRVGMSPRRVRHAMGSQMRTFITQQDVRVDLLAGPGGVTEWASLGAGRAFALGLAPTFQLAKRDAQIEGC
ncbi:MAG: hypothetical protein QOK30_2389 [Nocardioidaceae bacterium]|jgi:hypothetical protein|nr:hypothetical protein [Nocardioidaceae bacterium]